MKTFLKLLIIIWLIVWFFIGISSIIQTPNQIKKDLDFIYKTLKPSVDYIENYRNQNKRLPSKRDYYIWERVYFNDYTCDLSLPDSLLVGNVLYITNCKDFPVKFTKECEKVDFKKDYLLSVWRGEWEEYYLSWKNLYDGNNYSKADGYIGFAVNFGIGLLPLFIWYLNFKKKKLKISSQGSK